MLTGHELPQRLRHQLRRGALGPLVEHVGADHDLEGYDDDAALGGHLGGSEAVESVTTTIRTHRQASEAGHGCSRPLTCADPCDRPPARIQCRAWPMRPELRRGAAHRDRGARPRPRADQGTARGRAGISVSVATLSYWQSGRSQPGPQAVPGRAPPSRGAPRPRPRQPAARPDPAPRARTSLPGRGPRRGAGRSRPRRGCCGSLDTRWDAELERISLHDVVTMGPDRGQLSMQVRQVLRARCDGPDRRVVMHCLEDPQAGPPEIQAAARLRARARSPATSPRASSAASWSSSSRCAEGRPSWSSTR